MKAFKCDICGDYFDPVNKNAFDTTPYIETGFKTINGHVINQKMVDVCPLCMKDIKTLIETRRKTNES